MDYHDFGCGRGWGHSDVVHMNVSVRVVMVMMPYVRVVMVVMSDIVSYVSSMSGMVSLMVLHIGTSLKEFRLRTKEIIRPLQ